MGRSLKGRPGYEKKKTLDKNGNVISRWMKTGSQKANSNSSGVKSIDDLKEEIFAHDDGISYEETEEQVELIQNSFDQIKNNKNLFKGDTRGKQALYTKIDNQCTTAAPGIIYPSIEGKKLEVEDYGALDSLQVAADPDRVKAMSKIEAKSIARKSIETHKKAIDILSEQENPFKYMADNADGDYDEEKIRNAFHRFLLESGLNDIWEKDSSVVMYAEDLQQFMDNPDNFVIYQGDDERIGQALKDNLAQTAQEMLQDERPAIEEYGVSVDELRTNFRDSYGSEYYAELNDEELFNAVKDRKNITLGEFHNYGIQRALRNMDFDDLVVNSVINDTTRKCEHEIAEKTYAMFNEFNEHVSKM